PAGIGAYDLQESMMLQTEQDLHAPNVAYYLLEVFFDELRDKDYAEIQAQTQISYDEIMESVNYFHTLRTNPAALFNQVDKINLIPDVTITPVGEGLQIRYNRQYYPDRKSTRLNSSHVSISYAVFCFQTKMTALSL